MQTIPAHGNFFIPGGGRTLHKILFLTTPAPLLLWRVGKNKTLPHRSFIPSMKHKITGVRVYLLF